MKIALTGGTGFLGHEILKQYSGEHSFRCWARNLDSVPIRGEKIEWIPGQLNSVEDAEILLADCDALIHAGLYRTSESFRGHENDLSHYLDTNLLGSIRLFEAAILRGLSRIVFVSTCAVHERILNDRKLDETHPTWAFSHYGAHKAAIEQFIYSFAAKHPEVSISGIRPTGIYGVHHQPAKSKWFELIRQVVSGATVEVQGGGKEVHVADVAKAIGILLRANDISGEVFNCYDRYISQHEVATIAEEIRQNGATIVGEPKSPKNQIETGKLRQLGMEFGGRDLLVKTVRDLVSLF